MGRTSERLEKIAPWGILGFSVTFVGVLMAIAIFYFQENSAKVHAGWWIRNEEKLVEVRESIKDLRILYHGQDLLESGKEIRILTLEFVNDGRNITQDMFDQNLAFGLRFLSSEIITGQVSRVTSQYLGDNLKPQIKAAEMSDNTQSSNRPANTLILPKLIFDHGSAFTLKAYLLQSNRVASNEITCLGKIAGLDSITINASQPVRAAGNGVWVAIVTALGSCLLGLGIYVIGLRAKANAMYKGDILEELRQELRDVCQQPQTEPKSASQVDDPSAKPAVEAQLPPTT